MRTRRRVEQSISIAMALFYPSFYCWSCFCLRSAVVAFCFAVIAGFRSSPEPLPVPLFDRQPAKGIIQIKQRKPKHVRAAERRREFFIVYSEEICYSCS